MRIELWPIDRVQPYHQNPPANDGTVQAVPASIHDEERWAAVPGYEELYEVSTRGGVRRSSKSRMAPAGYLLKQRLTWDGYPECSLCKRQKYWHVKTHRLVALAFLGPPPFPGAHVAHFDGDKTNNHVSNLRWATPAENEADKRRHGRTRGAWPGERHHLAKLTVDTVKAMRQEAACGVPIPAIAESFEVKVGTAYDAIFGATWTVVTDPAPLPRRRKTT